VAAERYERRAQVAEIDVDRVRDGLEVTVEAAAGAILEVLGQRRIRVEYKPGEGPVTEADHAADDVLHERLMPLIAGAQWLSEEARQDMSLLPGEATWVVDPLDGTREFLRGLPEFGISVGLFADDRLTLGAVALPVQGVVFSGLLAGDRRELRRNGQPLPVLRDDGRVARVVVSRYDYEHRALHHQIPYEVYPCGFAAVKLVHIVDQEVDVYLSTGPRSVWDVAGVAAVLLAAGGALLTFDGRPLRLSPRQLQIPPYAAGHPAACATLLRRLGARI